MLVLFGLSCFSWLVSEKSGIALFINKLLNRRDSRFSGIPVYKRLKPFDCAMCMGWWSGIAYEWYSNGISVQCIITGAIISVLSIMIDKIMRLCI